MTSLRKSCLWIVLPRGKKIATPEGFRWLILLTVALKISLPMWASSRLWFQDLPLGVGSKAFSYRAQDKVEPKSEFWNKMGSRSTGSCKDWGRGWGRVESKNRNQLCNYDQRSTSKWAWEPRVTWATELREVAPCGVSAAELVGGRGAIMGSERFSHEQSSHHHYRCIFRIK